MPVTGSMVPTAVLLLLQVPVPPDAVRLFRVIVDPAHTEERPLIAPATGDIFTVTFVVVVAVPHDPVVSVKVMVIIPGVTP